ncbi:M50 family metallopeptidase [Candidatus Woesearchaeota archaeon]|nr:M50 family metallopeptidase [Candidatus Woesearchaeota archaeon]
MFSLAETIDLVIMTVFVGFIFSGVFTRPDRRELDVMAMYRKRRFDWDGFTTAVIITAPAIILHEMGHKFVAIGFGLNAVFHASYTWLGLGVLLRLLNFGFIFFVPGYVSIPLLGSPLQHAAIAFAGPGINLLIWLIAFAVLKSGVSLSRNGRYILTVTKQINLFLFFFNMIPIPPFDGFSVFSSLWRAVA